MPDDVTAPPIAAVTAPRSAPTTWYEPMPVELAADGVLACSWTARPSGRHLLVPDACAELLWIRRPHPTVDRPMHQLVLCGPERRAWSFELPTGTVAAGIRIRPGDAHRLFALDVSSVADRRVDPAEVLGAAPVQALLAELATEPGTEPTDAELVHRARLLERFAVGLDRVAGPAPDGFVDTMLAALAAPGRPGNEALAEAVGVSGRQLHRRMLRTFGHGTATIGRLLRFQRFLAYTEPALAAGERSVARLATIAGYADQSHLARDCRAITGLTVRDFLCGWFPTFPDMSDPFKTPRPLAPILDA